MTISNHCHDLVLQERVLGSGAMGTVLPGALKRRPACSANPRPAASDCAATDGAEDTATTIEVAVKLVDKRNAQSVKRETETLRMFSGHPNILQAFGDLHHPGIDKHCLVMERLYGGDLEEFLEEHGAFDASTTINIMCQVFTALVSMHEKGVGHLDIKPANIMVRQKTSKPTSSHQPDIAICLVDFGLSVVSPHAKMVSEKVFCAVRGTPVYAAPEVSGSRGYSIEKADVWSCGVTMFQLLRDQLPYDPPDEWFSGCPFGAVARFVAAKGQPPDPVQIYPKILSDCYSFTCSCLKLDPDCRPTASKALGELQRLKSSIISPDKYGRRNE